MKQLHRVALFAGFMLLSCKVSAQVITTIAGTGVIGFSGDSSAAVLAQLGTLRGLVFDTSGNLYIADGGNNRIRKIDIAGIITTVAGTGGVGYTGDGGPAILAQIPSLNGITMDNAGNTFLTGHVPGFIRKIDAAGIITTLAGAMTGLGYNGDEQPATNAWLEAPQQVALDGSGEIYFADELNYRVRKVDHMGIIHTVAGNGSATPLGDGIAATAAGLGDVKGVAFDDDGNMYIGNGGDYSVRKVDAAGIITTVAGTGVAGYSGDGGPATAAQFSGVTYLAFDHGGNLFISDEGANTVRKIDASGMVSTVAGTGVLGYSGDYGPATAATMHAPYGIAFDCADNLYIAEMRNYVVRKVIFDHHPPAFTAGHSQSVAVCGDIPTAINAMLAIMDTDAGQSETWKVIGAAAHGTASAAYTSTSTGSVVTPAGLTYTPAAGYLGYDTFRVAVFDCSRGSDTTTVYVTVGNCALGAPAVSGNGCYLAISPNPCAAVFAVCLYSPYSEEARLVVTNMLGEKVGELTTPTNHPTDIQLNLAPGIYFVSAATAHTRRTEKLVVSY